MGYNPNKNAGKPQSTAPKAEGPAPQNLDDYKRPVGGLSVLPAGAEEYQDIGGVFAAKNKNGKIYLKCKDKEGNRFQISLNENPMVELVEKKK